MTRVLIVATNDDSQTCMTFFWAKELQRCLAEVGHETVFLGGYDVTFTGLTNAIASSYPRIEYVVFYGHGDHDRLYGQRTDATAEQAPILVDDLHADVFRGANVYAVACYALDILGQAHQRDNPTARFIGYNDLFAKSEYDFDLFRLCVHHGAVLFVAGMDGHATSSILKKCWEGLRDEYLTPPPGGRFTLDKVWAAFAADINAEGVGYK